MKNFIRVFVLLILLLGVEKGLQAQWVQTSGPGGGNVHCFAVNSGNVFAGSESGGVFLTTNNGTNWYAADSGLPHTTFVSALAISGGKLFAGTDSGVFLSTNNGTNWTLANKGIDSLPIYAVMINGSDVFAG